MKESGPGSNLKTGPRTEVRKVRGCGGEGLGGVSLNPIPRSFMGVVPVFPFDAPLIARAMFTSG